MPAKPEKVIQLDLLNKFMSPKFQNQDRRKIANTLKDRFMKDPQLLAEFERLLGAKTTGLARIAPTAAELKSFGWTEQEVAECPAAVVAAAAATWAAAAAQKV